MNQHTIECLGMFQKCDWYTGLVGETQRWLKTFEEQEALFHGPKHTRKSSSSSSTPPSNQLSYSTTVQRLKQEFVSYKTLLNAFTTGGEYLHMCTKIRSNLKIQNKVIHFFLQKEVIRCSSHHSFSYNNKDGHDSKAHYDALVKTYADAMTDTDLRKTICKLIRAQRTLVQMDATTNRPKTPFRTHMYHSQPLVAFHQSNTRPYRKMVFMDNLLLKLPSKSVANTSASTSFGASLVAFVATRQTQPTYKKLRSFFLHKDTMVVQPYFDIHYSLNPQTQRKRLLVEPRLVQKEDETRRSSNNRVRYSPFNQICLLFDLYSSFLPHVANTKTINQTGAHRGQGITQHDVVLQNLKQNPTFVLHPVSVAKVYNIIHTIR